MMFFSSSPQTDLDVRSFKHLKIIQIIKIILANPEDKNLAFPSG
jgi:hypothetical protein